MAEWKVWAKMIKIPGEKMLKLQFETPDAGMGQAMYDNLQRLYRYSQEENIFANPLLILNDPDIPDGTGGAVGTGTGEFSQGKPIIQIPPSQSGTIYITPPDPNDRIRRRSV